MKNKKSPAGRKTKESQGLRRYKRLNITLPPELWDNLEAMRKAQGMGVSEVIQYLLYKVIYQEKWGKDERKIY